MINRSIELVPAPTTNTDLALTYYASIPALADDDTNWLLDKAPDLYLYASLLEAAPYLKNDQRIPVWMNAAAQAADGLRMDSERAMRPTTRMAKAPRGFY